MKKQKQKIFTLDISTIVARERPTPSPKSWAELHLFWGVPVWARFGAQLPSGDFIFSDKPLL